MTDESQKKVKVKIIEFDPRYAGYFRDLNYEWLKKYFEVEPYDRIVLENPVNHIIKMGGVIFFALVDNEVAGTCALMKHAEKKYELAKMGVTEKFQNMGIGRKLVEATIEKSKQLGADKLILGTSKCLKAANHLYKKMGFDYCDINEIGPLPYIRETVVMKMDLS
ncbi:MAG: GNAT family N-acetyltransferase [bacterium]